MFCFVFFPFLYNNRVPYRDTTTKNGERERERGNGVRRESSLQREREKEREREVCVCVCVCVGGVNRKGESVFFSFCLSHVFRS